MAYTSVSPTKEMMDESPSSYHALSALTPHGSIVIGNDTALAAWPGSGTEVDPYRIEGLNITVANTSIRVANTTKHFVIENCFVSSPVYNPDIYEPSRGIIISNVSHGRILNCTVTSEWSAIRLESVTNFTVMNCTLFDVDSGINSIFVNYTLISNNNLQDINSGIHGAYCHDTVISANHVSNWRHYGISVSGNNVRTEVSENFVYQNSDPYWSWYGGITLQWTSGVLVNNNSVSDCQTGIFVDFWSYDIQITNNYVENCSTGFHVMFSSNISIEGNRMTDVVFAFNVYESEYIKLLDNDIDTETYRDIYLSVSRYCEIEGNTMESSGIYIEGISPTHWNHSIENNYIDNRKIGYFIDSTNRVIQADDYAQIILAFCQNVTVTNGVFSNVQEGVVMAYCEGCELSNSLLTENIYSGVKLFYTTSCTITDCNITENGLFPYGYGGILLAWTDGTTITRNRIYSNNGTGISNGLYLGMGSRNCLIYNNVITNNTYGITFSFDSEDNIIYGNIIGWNSELNALDYGHNNTWDNGLDVGNCWSDYNGTGSYEIPGGADAIDRFPQNCTSWDLALPMSDPEVTDFTLVVIAAGGLAGVIIVVVILLRKRAGNVHTPSASIAEEVM
ncbi:MAG: right-handed parallel beta-helix repeat-containing protein [Candidatus Thorarchaeota archaeon]